MLIRLVSACDGNGGAIESYLDPKEIVSVRDNELQGRAPTVIFLRGCGIPLFSLSKPEDFLSEVDQLTSPTSAQRRGFRRFNFGSSRKKARE